MFLLLSQISQSRQPDQMNTVIIKRPSIDFHTFLDVANSALGYSPAVSSDSSKRKLSDAERFISYLAAIRDSDAKAGFIDSLLAHLSYSVLLAAPEKEILGIISYLDGASFVVTETVISGVSLAVITGSLLQWKNAIADGLAAKSSGRRCYNELYNLFIDERLNVWSDYKKGSGRDGLLLLTYNPKMT